MARVTEERLRQLDMQCLIGLEIEKASIKIYRMWVTIIILASILNAMLCAFVFDCDLVIGLVIGSLIGIVGNMGYICMVKRASNEIRAKYKR